MSDAQGHEGVVLDIPEEQLHRAERQDQPNGGRALRPVAAQRGREADEDPDEHHARERAEDAVHRDGIRPAEQNLAELPPLGMEEDIQRRLPHIGEPVGIGECLYQQLGVPPAQVADGEDVEAHAGDEADRQPHSGRREPHPRERRAHRWDRLPELFTAPGKRERDQGEQPAHRRRQVGDRPKSPGNLFRKERSCEMECNHQRRHDAKREQQAARRFGQTRRHNNDFTACGGARQKAHAGHPVRLRIAFGRSIVRALQWCVLANMILTNLFLHPLGPALILSLGGVVLAVLRRMAWRSAVSAQMVSGRPLKALPKTWLSDVRLPVALLAVLAATALLIYLRTISPRPVMAWTWQPLTVAGQRDGMADGCMELDRIRPDHRTHRHRNPSG